MNRDLYIPLNHPWSSIPYRPAPAATCRPATHLVVLEVNLGPADALAVVHLLL
jgi:hypothetical protein